MLLLPQSPATGKPSGEGLVRGPGFCSFNPRLEARGSGNFLRWESVVGLKRLGVFRVNRQRRGVSLLVVVARALRVYTACTETLRSAGKMPTMFIFHLSLQEVGGVVRRGGRGSPARPRLNFRAEETYLRSPSFPPPPAQPCPWAPSWLDPAQQEEGMLGHQHEEFPAMG